MKQQEAYSLDRIIPPKERFSKQYFLQQGNNLCYSENISNLVRKVESICENPQDIGKNAYEEVKLKINQNYQHLQKAKIQMSEEQYTIDLSFLQIEKEKAINDKYEQLCNTLKKECNQESQQYQNQQDSQKKFKEILENQQCINIKLQYSNLCQFKILRNCKKTKEYIESFLLQYLNHQCEKDLNQFLSQNQLLGITSQKQKNTNPKFKIIIEQVNIRIKEDNMTDEQINNKLNLELQTLLFYEEQGKDIVLTRNPIKTKNQKKFSITQFQQILKQLKSMKDKSCESIIKQRKNIGEIIPENNQQNQYLTKSLTQFLEILKFSFIGEVAYKIFNDLKHYLKYEVLQYHEYQATTEKKFNFLKNMLQDQQGQKRGFFSNLLENLYQMSQTKFQKQQWNSFKVNLLNQELKDDIMNKELIVQDMEYEIQTYIRYEQGHYFCFIHFDDSQNFQFNLTNAIDDYHYTIMHPKKFQFNVKIKEEYSQIYNFLAKEKETDCLNKFKKQQTQQIIF